MSAGAGGAAGARAPGARAPGARAGEGALPPLRFACPRCRGPVEAAGEALGCRACGATYAVEGGIPQFVGAAPYWGEIPEEDLAWLVGQVEGGRPWRDAVLSAPRPAIRKRAAFLLDERRANWILDLDLPPGAEVLDVGAGLGGVAASLARHAARVVALEPVELRARFTAARSAQDGLEGVEVVRGGAIDPPFPPASFDLVVLSGVLEWLGRGSPDPRAAQLAALRRLGELLRPQGTLVVGIENRIGIWFFLGRQDHSYLPYTSLLPRRLASLVTRRLRGHPYDTYTYTHRGYRRLFAQAGLPHLRTVLPVWSYNAPDFLVPLEPGPRSNLRAMLVTTSGRARRPWIRELHSALRLSRPLANDFLFFARRQPEPAGGGGWLRRLLLERWSAWGLGPRPERLSLLVYNRNHPILVAFPDGAREPRLVARLSPLASGARPAPSPARTEIDALRLLDPRLEGRLAQSVPRPLDLLARPGYEIGVTTYVPGRPPLVPGGRPGSPPVVAAVARYATLGLDWLGEFHRQLGPRVPRAELNGGELAAAAGPALGAAGEGGRALGARLEGLLASLGTVGTVARAPQHGDFILANLRFEGDRVGVIDWERFGRIRMPGFDALHFVTCLAMLVLADPRTAVTDVGATVRLLLEPGPLHGPLRDPLARYLEAQGIDPARAPALFPAYVAAFIGEYGGDPFRRGIVATMTDLLEAMLAAPEVAAGAR